MVYHGQSLSLGSQHREPWNIHIMSDELIPMSERTSAAIASAAAIAAVAPLIEGELKRLRAALERAAKENETVQKRNKALDEQNEALLVENFHLKSRLGMHWMEPQRAFSLSEPIQLKTGKISCLTRLPYTNMGLDQRFPPLPALSQSRRRRRKRRRVRRCSEGFAQTLLASFGNDYRRRSPTATLNCRQLQHRTATSKQFVLRRGPLSLIIDDIVD